MPSKITGAEMDLKMLGIDTDEIAVKTSWNPMFDTAGSFRALQLKRVNSKHIEFAPTFGFAIFSLIFLVLGAGVIFLEVMSLRNGKSSVLLTILGGLFFTGGGSLIFFRKNYISFQQLDGKWRLSKRSMLLSGPSLRYSSTVYAIQLLEKRIADSENPYNAYELNIVYDNGARENILNQGNYNATLKDAVSLSKFLTIPLWNGIVRHHQVPEDTASI